MMGAEGGVVRRASLKAAKERRAKVYQYPSPYKCERCGFEETYSQDHQRTAPVFANDETGFHEPVCSHCFEEFMRDNCGILRPNR